MLKPIDIGYKTPLLFLLGGFLPSVAVLSSMSNTNTLNVTLSFTLCSLSAYFLAQNVHEPRLNIYDFGFWVFTYVWMGFAPLIQFASNSFPTTTADLDLNYALEAQFLVFLGVLAYIFGVRRRISEKDSFPQMPIGGIPGRAIMVPASLAIISVFATFLYISAVGWSTLFLYRSEKRLLLGSITEDTVAQTIIFTLGWVLSLVAGITFFYIAKQSSRKFYWLVSFGALLPCLLLTNPLSTARFVSMTVYGGIVMAFLHANGKLPIKTFKMGFLSSIFVLFPVLNYFRNNPDSQYANQVRLDFVSGDYDAFAQIVNTVEYTHRSGQYISDQFLGPVLFWLPRQFWVDKPIDTGILLADFKGYTFTNLSAPLWTEALISFSPIGLIVCFAILGRVFRSLDAAFESNRQVIMSAFFPGALYTLIILRGSLLQATGGLVVLIVSGYLIQIASRRQIKKR
jgi:hypothetical protein